jgi:hypothetical protein
VEEDFRAAASAEGAAARSKDLVAVLGVRAFVVSEVRLPPKTERPAPTKARAAPDDCLGLTKRWSLYVAPSVNSGSRLNF